MVNANDIKNGMTILFEDNIYVVLEFSHVKPGKGAAFVKAKLKNLRTGSIVEKTFNSSIKLERAMIQKVDMQYLYGSGDSYNFMNMETYEQIEIPASHLGDDAKFLKIIKTEPAVKGNTTNNATKEATIETGLIIKVPLFIEEGENVLVSTSDGKYVSRA